MNYLNELIIIAAQYFIFIPILILLFSLYKDKYNKKKFILYALISFILIYTIALTAGSIYYNPRPFVVDNSIPLISHLSNNGFPSHHTLFAAAISAILLFFSRKLSILSWIFTILVGIARVAAEVHHVIDIVGSVLIALVGASIVYYFMFVFRNRRM